VHLAPPLRISLVVRLQSVNVAPASPHLRSYPESESGVTGEINIYVRRERKIMYSPFRWRLHSLLPENRCKTC
jgi:hypothetical protein